MSSFEPSISSYDQGGTSTGESAGRLMIALQDCHIQEAIEQSLVRDGWEFNFQNSGAGLVESIKRDLPDVVVVASDLPHLDIGSCVRIINRYPDSRSVVFVLICPSAIERSQVDRLRQLGFFQIFQMPVSPTAVGQCVDEAYQYCLQLKEKFGLKKVARAPATRHVECNSSLLVRQITCPFHKEPVTLDRYILRTGRIETETHFFDLPIYKAATRGADFINYHLLGVAVCPVCLFASNNPACFRDPAEKSIKPIEYTPQTIASMQAAISARRQLAGQLPRAFFTHERTLDQAIIANALAIHCSQTLYEHNKYTMPIELLRLANHHLRQSLLLETRAAAPEKMDIPQRAAFDWLKKAFLLLEGPALHKTIYQLVALAIWFGEDKAAFQYIARMNEILADAVTTAADKASIERYLPRCKLAWEDRDSHRGPLFESPSEKAA